MRIIAGTARGTRLATPKNRAVRPTLDRLRETLFNILAPRIEGAAFLDLFAGTGANGLEALSRGARICTFVDNDGRSVALIRRNLRLSKLGERAQVRKLTCPSCIDELAERGESYDLIFADPPYKFAQYRGLFSRIAGTGILAPDGLLVMEHATRTSVEGDAEGLVLARQRRLGEATLSFFTHQADG